MSRPPAAGYAAPAAPVAPHPQGPVPPALHWVLVLIISMFTGIFGLIWFFIQAGFVKRIDPSSHARMYMVLWLLSFAGDMIAVIAGALVLGQSHAMLVALISMALAVVGIVFSLAAVFSIRSSLVQYYNTVEPIGLRLSGVMTFFFNILYFQYHLSRIANWKRTGVLQ